MDKHAAAGAATAIIAPSLAPLLALYYAGNAVHVLTKNTSDALSAKDDPPNLWNVFLTGLVNGLAYWGMWYLWQKKANQ